jgi:D-serine deaminase-like pyridoxal phosphate-dependent protein
VHNRATTAIVKLEDLPTPSLILDRSRASRNVARLKSHLSRLKVPLRPHLKSSKSLELAQLLMSSPTGPATVSTVKEAEVLADAGVRDILYGVGIAPSKLLRIVALRRRGIDVIVVLDSYEQALAVVSACRDVRERIPVLIEIDSDGHRSGISPGDPQLVEIGRLLADGGAELRGVMTHAGGSYGRPGVEDLMAAAESERIAAVRCAEDLRQAGLSCDVVSVGSTPTAFFAKDLTGVTEVRAGVFVFLDLVMAGLGVCTPGDIALSVLATVIGRQEKKGWILVDAGWMAMSLDRGTEKQKTDYGFGLVCDVKGVPYPDLIVIDANQEHGILSIRSGGGSRSELPNLPVGSLVRILPNHACATAAQFDRYHVVNEISTEIVAVWPRFSGW